MADGERATNGEIEAELERAVDASSALAYIVVFEVEVPRRVYVMSRETIVVGRDNGAELRVRDESVSGRHVRITIRSHRFEIEDLGSTNGTCVGGRRVERATAHSGDRVVVGTTELMLLLERPTSATARLPDASLKPSREAVGAAGLVAQVVTSPRLGLALRNRGRDDELTIVELVERVVSISRLVRKRAIPIAALAGGAALLGLLSTWVFPPGVTATSEVKLLPHVSLSPNQEHDRWGPNDEGSAAFARAAERALTQPDLMRKTLVAVEGKAPSDTRVLAALRDLKVEEAGDHVFRVGYRERTSTTSPADLLNVHLQGYVRGEVDRALRESRGKVDFLREQVKLAEKDLAQIGQDRESFRSMNVDRLPEEAAQTHTSHHELESRHAEILVRTRQLAGELAAEQAQLTADRPSAQTRFHWSETYRASLADVNRKLSEAYARGLKDSHPDVQQLRDERERLQQLEKAELEDRPSTLARESDPNTLQVQRRIAQLRAELSSARASLAATEQALGRVRRVVQDLPRVERRMADLDRQQEATKQLHAELFAKMKQAEIELNLDKVSAESRFDVAPATEDRPRSARLHATRAGLGLVIGLLLAAMVLLFDEARRMVSQALAQSAGGTAAPTLLRRDFPRGPRL